MAPRKRKKLGRNDPCHCGSGKKYKKCHFHKDKLAGQRPHKDPSINPEEIQKLVRRHAAKEKLRESSQGHGKPIVSTEFKGYRVTAVGNQLCYSPAERTQTFVDFLNQYIKGAIGADWGNREIKKPLEERNPILQWYDSLCKLQKKHAVTQGQIYETPMTGVVWAYTSLAYNLYLLQHNAEVQQFLIKRLKQKNSFYAAYYETFVAAWFILSGFELTLENEQDPTTSHCEFSAKSPKGEMFSIEAKSRAPMKPHFSIGNQLYKALKKKADYKRIIFIDLNISSSTEFTGEEFVHEITSRLRNIEPKMTIDGNPAPPAYVVVTNQPFHLHLDQEDIKKAMLADGFKIPDFGFFESTSLIDAYKAREKHSEVHRMLDAIENYKIPSTFDGELPEFAFGNTVRTLLIGETYDLGDGKHGTLTSGIVSESEKKAYLTYTIDGNTNSIYTAPLSDEEISAYKRHPETFFGEIQHVGKNCKDPLELFYFIYNSYKEAPRETILKFFKDAPDIDELNGKSIDELRLIYAERCVYSIIAQSDKNNKDGPK
jgi:hypothetical protein